MVDDEQPEAPEATERPAGEAGTGAEDTHAHEGTDGTPTRAAGDTGEGPVPYHRFREVNEKASRYAKLGTPEEIAERLGRATAYERREQEQAEERRRAEAAATPDPKRADREAAKDTLRELWKETPEYQEQERARVQQETFLAQQHATRGLDMLDRLMTEKGLPLDAESKADWHDRVETVLFKDKDLGTKFWSPSQQAEAVREAFNRTVASTNRLLQQQGARTLDDARARRERSLPRATQSGTSAPKPAEFTSKHEAGSLGWKRDRAAHRSRLVDAALDEREEATS